MRFALAPRQAELVLVSLRSAKYLLSDHANQPQLLVILYRKLCISLRPENSTLLITLFQIGDPEKYSVTEKPLELNLMGAAPRRAGGGANQNHGRPHDIMMQPPMAMPYGCYPAPQMFFPFQPQQPWPTMPQQMPPGPQPGLSSAQNTSAPPKRSVKGPGISTWLQYCDHHPSRQGENFQSLSDKFDEQGYRTIDQLTSSRVTIEKLSGWLSIGKGTADYIIEYADEDMALVREGKFTMDISDTTEGFEDGWS